MRTTLLTIVSTIFLGGCIGHQQTKIAQSSTTPKEFKDTVFEDKFNIIIMGRFIENDTTFFLKEFDKEDGKQYLNASIYIEPDKNSIYYKRIAQRIFDPKKDQYQLDGWKRYRQEKQMPLLQKVDLLDLPTDWVPLHLYQNHYYVFDPCEVDMPFRRCLTDSTLAYYSMEFYFNAIQKLEKKSKSLYYLELEERSENSETDITQIYIHIIDIEKKVAVWEYREKDKSKYELMIPIESAKDFEMIICDCPRHKFFNESVFDFDEIDFQTLLKQQKL